MRGRRLGTVIALTGSMAVGGVAGAALGVPGLSGAATPWPADQVADQNDSSADAAAFQRGPGARGGLLAAAAEALNLDVDALLERLRDGETMIADVAQEQNVDLNAVIDAMAAQSREHIEEMVNNPLPERGPRGHGHGHFGIKGADAAAEALGITTEELREAVRDGKSIADIAAEKNVDVNAVIDAMVADAEAKIDEAQQSGKLSEERATEMKENVRERITALVNGERPERPERPGRPFGPRP